MPVTIKVNGSSNSLVHKGSNGIANSTVPDVCKTPSPAGPVPIPYPIIVSMSSDLASGSTTVTADGGNMIAIKGCEFSRCTGDEPGTVGGVKSSTFMQEAKFILYSFDVKIDGQNACRLTDKMTMNHENTVCLAGVLQIPVIPHGLSPTQKVACAIYCCDNAKYTKKKHKKKRGMTAADVNGQDCRSLSTTKHSCVMHSLRKANDPKVKASPRYGPNISGPNNFPVNAIPDTVVDGRVIDAKFPCDSNGIAPINNASHPSDMSVVGTEMLTPKETDVYSKLPGTRGDPTAMTPADAEKKKSDDCDCKYEKFNK
jgi:hypothetical protein